jgi:hypothetical protein
MNSVLRGVLLSLILLICLVSASYAADTVETYGKGAGEFEIYLGGDGFNLPKYEKAVSGDLLVGYGLLDRFSGYMTLSAASNEYLTDAEGAYSFGIFGTPVDTDHVDFDLMLNAGMGGENFSQIAVSPGFELNFDLKPDMKLWGVYIRVSDGMSGRDESVADNPDTPNVDETNQKMVFTMAIDQTLGTYVTIKERHQILAEYYQTSYVHPGPEEPSYDIGGFALGYNVVLVDNLELITQINARPGYNHADGSVGGFVGLIAVVPNDK